MTRGLGPVSRGILAFFSTLFGVVMYLAAPDDGKAIYFYAIGALCLVIALACLTKGRVREFFGCVIAAAVVLLSGYFIYAEAMSGQMFPRGGNGSLVGAILFSIAFGVPAIRYIRRVRFGMHRDA
jgi:hypothetical protein